MESPVPAVDTTAAEAYERHLVPPVFGPWADYLVGVAVPHAGERVLDVGCGTGVVTRLAAQSAGSAVGIDIDPAMIEVARRRDAGGEYQIHWMCGDVSRLGIGSATFDLCLCGQALQHFPDREHALSELRRVLTPNGRLVAAVWADIEHTPGVLAVLQALESACIDASAFRRPFALGNAAVLHGLARDAGFAFVDVRQHEKSARFASVQAFLSALNAGSAASRGALSRVSRDRWSEFSADVQSRLKRFVQADRLEFPYRANILVALR
jgi:SAM-dependent methyltransferase